MSEQISSLHTFIMKWIFPTVWITGFGLGALLSWFDTRSGMPLGERGMFPVFWILGSAFILAVAVPLKRVRIDGDRLLVSNYLREESTPLHNIVDVTESRWINLHPVTLHLRDPIGFGQRVTFMPTTRLFGFWSSHPIVADLKARARADRLSRG
jgi:hypothetical protein